VGIAFSGATTLNFALLLMIYVGWKRLWSWFPVLNTLVFPDINGSWKMRIHWQKADASGIARARAFIKQDLLRFSMEVSSEDSDSETLIALPRRDPESGRPLLYYVYRVVPKNIKAEAKPSYEGAAILRLSHSEKGEFSGNYFTSRWTTGHFELTR
jgi:SMODS-associating 2TM, beta-strand rich effector domain